MGTLDYLAADLGTQQRLGEPHETDPMDTVPDEPDLPTATDVIVSPKPPRHLDRKK